eukprot:scaffold65965_cov18-Tisochrysis_lutea.AAC.1
MQRVHSLPPANNVDDMVAQALLRQPASVNHPVCLAAKIVTSFRALCSSVRRERTDKRRACRDAAAAALLRLKCCLAYLGVITAKLQRSSGPSLQASVSQPIPLPPAKPKQQLAHASASMHLRSRGTYARSAPSQGSARHHEAVMLHDKAAHQVAAAALHVAQKILNRASAEVIIASAEVLGTSHGCR